MTQRTRIQLALLLAGLLVLLFAAGPTVAAQLANTTAAQVSPLHPVFPLLDSAGDNVLDSNAPASTLTTCGACHDTAFITEHDAHAGRLVGTSRTPANEAVLFNSEANRLAPLPEVSGELEMNCFLCHSVAPNNEARLAALAAGNYAWANTATLTGTPLLTATGDGYNWNRAAFDADGNLLPENILLQDPGTDNCAQCHGAAATDATTPLALDACDADLQLTVTTGQVFSPQRISMSGLNIRDKNDLSRTWDVHAERVVGCTDCHYALNNPAYDTESGESRPDHLLFDPRRLEPGEFLHRPLHELARTDDDDVTAHACADCHEIVSTHDWLPYTERHMQELACETCHVPRQEAPAQTMVDWTVLNTTGAPVTACGGLEPNSGENLPLIYAVTPPLLPRDTGSGDSKLAPYNLTTSFYWVAGDDAAAIPLAALQAAYLDGDDYRSEIIAAFDLNGDGVVDSNELRIRDDAQTSSVAALLSQQGYNNPRIASDVAAYAINHGVTHGDWAVSDCSTCHSEDSRMGGEVVLAAYSPGGTAPQLGDDLGSMGVTATRDDGSTVFQPATGTVGSGNYLLGYSNVAWVDYLGVLAFLGTLAGVVVHGGLRMWASRRIAKDAHGDTEVRQVYMYSFYERLWHWLQTAVILILIWTGLVIHKPDMFGMFSFRWMVQIHNIMAAILVVNAALALFYHLASGEIRQFIPQPRGFFNQAVAQTLYYVRGIFRNDPHPFEKTPDRKLNPLQQIVYTGLLNVLLPLQVITGTLMWGVQRWPDVAAQLGGLPFLAPFHSLIAWLLATFVVMHVYLTTTGHTPLAGIRGMMMGWDEVEVHAGTAAD